MTTAFDPAQRAPRSRPLDNLLREFSPFERMLLYIFSILMALSAFVLVAKVNALFMVEVPARGGRLVEGAVGTPRFVNPLLAASQSDQDLAALIYSGLLRRTADGFTPDLAASYEISDDGTVYTFRLREGLTFHDGAPLTAEDVLFTATMAQDPVVRSARRADWDGVSVTVPDPSTVVFTLPHPYAPFLDNLTMGILPKHLWETVPPQEFPFSPLNTHPVGSGPYTIRNVTFDSTGAPTEYRLVPFDAFALGAPHLTRITYRIYANDEALYAAFGKGDIDSFVSSSPKLLPSTVQEKAHLIRIPLGRVFGIFFNQNQAPVLASASVREALNAAVDKQAIIDSVLGGFGAPLDGPVPPGLLSLEDTATTSPAEAADAEPLADRAEEARAILARGGWSFETPSASEDADEEDVEEVASASGEGTWTRNGTPLTLTLATAGTDELAATARAVADFWEAAGIRTHVQVYPIQEFNSNVLRPRSYDAVLFGKVIGPSLDLFAFWHSSQRNDPGLNLALYTNAAADRALTDARAAIDPAARVQSLEEFLAAVAEDRPAVFLYAPDIAYLVPSHLQGIEIGTVTTPSERFTQVHRWYRDTERVWEMFAQSATQ